MYIIVCNCIDEKTSLFGSGGQKGREIARVRIVKEQSLYIIRDPDQPPPHDVALQAQKEEDFTSYYKQKTGWSLFF